MKRAILLMIAGLLATAISCAPPAANLATNSPQNDATLQQPTDGQSAAPAERVPDGPRLRGTTAGDRKAAAERAAALRADNPNPTDGPGPGGVPDYFGPSPNWALSPAPTVDPQTGALVGGIRKFHDALPGLGSGAPNNLGQYIPVAVPDQQTYVNAPYNGPASDYYEIALVEYSEQMHFDLPPTRLRGYVQVSTAVVPGLHIPLVDPNGAAILDANNQPVFGVDHPHYLGPTIVAQKDRPVRVKFSNYLAKGAGGNLFIPVDTSVMGAGMGPLDMPNMPGMKESYTQNRATLHLHGGHTPWISDGTPHQWTTPAGETTQYPKGVSVENVPDMPPQGPGSLTFFYSNQQSARLLFYHDHAYGITRLNVYAGEAAGYVIRDATEQQLVNNHIIPGAVAGEEIPLIIQDKTFVDATTVPTLDPTWNWGTTPPVPHTGDLWFPHVYMPNQNPTDLMGVNAMGRWDYGPWFWPPLTRAAGLIHTPLTGVNGAPMPATPNPSLVPEAFMDTPVINGTAYPYVTLQPKAYRFRVLNACNDRYLNLQLYYAEPLSIALTAGGTGYTTAPTVSISGGGGSNAAAVAFIDAVAHTVSAVVLTNPGTGYTSAPTVTLAGGGGTGATATASVLTEVKMVPAFPRVYSPPDLDDPTPEVELPPCAPGMTSGVPPFNCWPDTWPTDGRDGGVPDPTTAGPQLIQIGTEAGFLPAPAVIDNTPIGYNYNRRDITVLNVSNHSLLLGPAERADVIIDFAAVPPGSKLILYNDAPAPVPAFDSRTDYYTGDPDQTSTGGAPTTFPGYGPNTRTIMRIEISGTAAQPFSLANLQAAFASTGGTPGAFATSQNPIMVPSDQYNSAYAGSFPGDGRAYARIQSTSMDFTPLGGQAPLHVDLLPKAIQELFELNYGRMNAILGVELPLTNFATQTTIPYGYVDPATEIVTDSVTAGPPAAGDGSQFWKITHNGVDTHAIHFHLFDVQLINRIGWDGMVKPPESNELGWKDTVRMNPLEDAVVALRATAPRLPFKLPDSVRPMDVTVPIGDPSTFTNVDPNTGNPIVPPLTNQYANYGWEYVWHCHLLGHEENDMMRPIVFLVSPAIPSALTATPSALSETPPAVTLAWNNTATNPAATLFTIQRATDANFTANLVTLPAVTPPTTTATDPGLTPHTTYYYRVRAENAAGYSVWSSTATVVTNGWLPPHPTGLIFVGSTGTTITIRWTDNAPNEQGFYVERAPNNNGNPGNFVRLPINPPLGANTTTFTNTGLIRNTTYWYRVQAFNADGTSQYSNNVSGRTLRN